MLSGPLFALSLSLSGQLGDWERSDDAKVLGGVLCYGIADYGVATACHSLAARRCRIARTAQMDAHHVLVRASIPPCGPRRLLLRAAPWRGLGSPCDMRTKALLLAAVCGPSNPAVAACGSAVNRDSRAETNSSLAAVAKKGTERVGQPS